VVPVYNARINNIKAWSLDVNLVLRKTYLLVIDGAVELKRHAFILFRGFNKSFDAVPYLINIGCIMSREIDRKRNKTT